MRILLNGEEESESDGRKLIELLTMFSVKVIVEVKSSVTNGNNILTTTAKWKIIKLLLSIENSSMTVYSEAELQIFEQTKICKEEWKSKEALQWNFFENFNRNTPET